MRIYETTCDGYYVVVKDSGVINAYEGFDLCPADVKKQIKENGARQLDCFYDEAIKYGYAK